MKTVSAKMAREIAKDFNRNGLAPILDKEFDKILSRASEGHLSAEIKIPISSAGVAMSAAKMAYDFFAQLGYKRSNYGTNGLFFYFTVSWE
jgi:hypothetical protein